MWLYRRALSSCWSNHCIQGKRALAGAGVATSTRRGWISGTRLRSWDDRERYGRPVGQGRVRVEPWDQVYRGRAGWGSQLFLPCVRREQSRPQSSITVRLRHSITATWYVELDVSFRHFIRHLCRVGTGSHAHRVDILVLSDHILLVNCFRTVQLIFLAFFEPFDHLQVGLTAPSTFSAVSLDFGSRFFYSYSTTLFNTFPLFCNP